VLPRHLVLTYCIIYTIIIKNVFIKYPHNMHNVLMRNIVRAIKCRRGSWFKIMNLFSNERKKHELTLYMPIFIGSA